MNRITGGKWGRAIQSGERAVTAVRGGVQTAVKVYKALPVGGQLLVGTALGGSVVGTAVGVGLSVAHKEEHSKYKAIRNMGKDTETIIDDIHGGGNTSGGNTSGGGGGGNTSGGNTSGGNTSGGGGGGNTSGGNTSGGGGMYSAPNPWSHLQMPTGTKRKPRIRGGGVPHGPDPKIHSKKRRHHAKHPTDRKRK